MLSFEIYMNYLLISILETAIPLTTARPISSYTTQPILNCSGLSAGITWISCLTGITPTNSGSASTYTVSSGTFLLIKISAVQI